MPRDRTPARTRATGRAPQGPTQEPRRFGEPRPLLTRRVFVVGLGLLVVLGLVVGLRFGSSLTVALTFLPAFVAGVGTVRQTAVAAVCGFLVVMASLISDGSIDNYAPALIDATIGALCVLGCHLRIRRLEEVTRLRSIVASLQRQLLHPLPTRTDQIVADGLYQPIEEDGLIGGDFYDLESSPYGTRVLIADVQGKGVQAVGTTLALMAAFRESAHRELELTDVAEALENAVLRHNAVSRSRGEPERFVTALLLGFDGTDQVRAVDCGHVTPFVVRPDAPDTAPGGSVSPVDFTDAGLPLGLAELSNEPRHLKRFTLPADATLFVCTDGVTEARSTNGDFYPLEARLIQSAGLTPQELTPALREDLARFTHGEQRDDIAWLALQLVRATA